MIFFNWRNLAFRLVFFSLLCFSTTASAVQMRGLYDAEVPVSSQDAKEREQAIVKALARVMVKVTGDLNIARTPNAQKILKDAANYVQQYRYVKATDTIGISSGMQQALHVKFDGRSLNGSLRQLNYSIWGETRPEVLIWLALESSGQRVLFEKERHAEVHKVLTALSARRGLPLLFPLFDLEDQANIRISDVWGGFADVISNASRRYRTESILVGRVSQVSGKNWQARWTLFNGGQSRKWTKSATSLTGVLAAGIDGATDEIVKQFTAPAVTVANNSLGLDSDPSGVVLKIYGIAGITQYGRVLQYLTQLSQVVRAEPVIFDEQAVTVKVKLRGARSAFLNTVAIGEVLTPVENDRQPVALNTDGQVSGAGSSELSYRLLP